MVGAIPLMKRQIVSKSVALREGLETVLYARAPGSPLSCFDLGQDLAGSIQGLPRDLPTIPGA
jgi:hypothetical protein